MLYQSIFIRYTPPLFYNVQASITLQRNNCGTGYTGGTATYVVPAGTYSASSQTAADALAQADIAANAQTWVNNNASCTPLTLYVVRPFTMPGTFNWQSSNITSVDIFLVGGGGSGGGRGYNATSSISGGGGGGGYTLTHKNLPINLNQNIQIIIGNGGSGVTGCTTSCDGVDGNAGGFSQFMNTSYRVNGGSGGGRGRGTTVPVAFGFGGFGGSNGGTGGYDGYGDSGNYIGLNFLGNMSNQYGQGTTTRDFGELTGLINAGGGAGGYRNTSGVSGGFSDYTQGSGGDNSSGITTTTGGGGYGGGGSGGFNLVSSPGGMGTCIIRYYAP